MNNPINARTRQLHQLGQSLWVANISRNMPETGTLARYDNDIARLMREGLTSKATFFAAALFLTRLRKQWIERDPASVWLCGESMQLKPASRPGRPPGSGCWVARRPASPSHQPSGST